MLGVVLLKILYNELMKNHTSFKIGGPADKVIMPETEEELIEAVRNCREEKVNCYVMGNGSNILVRDGGVKGTVIKIEKNLSDISIKGNRITVQSGALLTRLSKEALKYSLKGLEFASGIPGTVGGAIAMNAGAYGGEMKDVVYKVKALDKKGEVIEYFGEEMNFGYRSSRVQDERLIVLEVEIELEKGNYDEIKEKMNDFTIRRKTKQPLEYPSAGSTFKRPEGYYAGKLIQDSGLKGLRHGGAQVSEKHSGFVINIENASSNDVENLIRVIQKTVKDKYNVFLEPELKVIGEKRKG